MLRHIGWSVWGTCSNGAQEQVGDIFPTLREAEAAGDEWLSGDSRREVVELDKEFTEEQDER